jgi:hypothetical protein
LSEISKGDFHEGKTTWTGTLINIGVGLIPVAGQVADARDTAAAAKNVWHKPTSGWAWLGLGAAVVGWVPGLGDAIKGGAKLGRKAVKEGAEELAKKGHKKELKESADKAKKEATAAKTRNVKSSSGPKPFRAKDFEFKTELQTLVTKYHDLLKGIARSMKTTAIGIVKTKDGSKLVIASSDKTVPTAIRKRAEKEGIEIISGIGHAEKTIIDWAKSKGWELSDIAPSRDFCLKCWLDSLKSRAQLHGNLKNYPTK